MIIGVPKEIKVMENRVALTPASASVLIAEGHTVLIESNAGLGSNFTDEQYMESVQQLFQQRRMHGLQKWS